MISDYDDIINLPHHVSPTRPQMPMINRAAQFAPFAALTGHEAALRETARATEKEVQLSDERLEILSRRMSLLSDKLDENPSVCVTFFCPDSRKEGGAYRKVTGVARKIREYERELELMTVNGRLTIPFRHIVDLEGEVLEAR